MVEYGDKRVGTGIARAQASECGALRRERAAYGRAPRVEERMVAGAALGTVPRYGRLAPRNAWPPLVVPQWSSTADPREDGPDDGGPGHEARTARGRGNRRLLLLGAARCFAARGYGGASLSDILAETGRERARPLSKSAFYVHFESKYDLARCLVDEACTSLSAVVESYSAGSAPDGGLSDPIWDVLAVSDSTVGVAMYDPVLRAAWRLGRDDDAFAATVTCSGDRDLERLSDMLARARDRRLLRDSVDPVRVIDHVNTLFAGHLTRTEGVPGAATPDLWDRMSTTWRQVLPAIATESWLVVWRTSGWAWRPRPDAEAFDRARGVGVA